MSLALKYRPKLFCDLVGQESVSQTLSLALDMKKISHAYLFSGLRGSGKTSSARIFARALQCDHGPISTPCGECENCKAALNGNHLDIIEMDAASNRRIDDIRDLVEQTKYRPGFGRYKIFIIDEVHMLTKEAFNALLKTLEEPPEFVKFILATTDPLLLPATILSRTQHFRFKKISPKLVVSHLEKILQTEGVEYEREALEIIARSGCGSLRDTLTLLDQAIIFGENFVSTSATTEMLGIINPEVLEEFFASILQGEEEKTQRILEVLHHYECEMIIDEMMLFLKDRAFSKQYPPLLINRFFSILAQSKTLLGLNTNHEFVLLLCVLKMREALKLKEISEVIAALEEQNTGMPDLPSPPITPPSVPKGEEIFAQLKKRIFDRSFSLGEIFEKNFTFLDYEQNRLHLHSQAQGEERDILAQSWKILKTMIEECFGAGTEIVFAPKPSQDPLPPQEPSRPLSPSEFKEKHQEFLCNLQEYLQVDLSSVKISSND